MRAGMARLAGVAVLALTAASVGCENKYKDGTALHARTVVLRREVEGLRAIAARLERHESLMPPGDASVAIADTLVRDILAAQLPLDVDVSRYHVSLRDVDVTFRGSPMVRLRGTLSLITQPSLEAHVDVIGALQDIAIDPSGSSLTARVAIDHLGIDKAAGLESFLSESTLSELGREIRREIGDELPRVQIPVHVQRTIDLPAVTRGPVRIDGATMPLRVSVSQVSAVRGQLWIALHFEPGEMTKTADAREAPDATAVETGFTLDADDAQRAAGRPGKGT